jgi:hypothetical protein
MFFTIIISIEFMFSSVPRENQSRSGELIMAKKPDVGKHFEVILGREIVNLSDEELLLRESSALWSNRV